MSPTERTILLRIERRAANMEPATAERLRNAYAVIRAALSEEELLRAYRNGTLDALIGEVLSDRSLDNAFSPLRELIDRKTLEEGANWLTRIPSVLQPPTFGFLNPTVLEAVRLLDSRVIRGLKDGVRESVREAVRSGIAAGKGPRVIARRVNQSVGLGAHQQRWVDNFRAELEAGDRAALGRVLGREQIRTPGGQIIERSGHAGGRGLGKRDLAMLDRMLGREELKPAQIDRMVEAYRKRLIALNVESSAKSITLDSQRLAQRLSWESSIASGFVVKSRLRRTRVTVGDNRVRPEHQAMDGETIGWDDNYSNGEHVPGDQSFSCRCIERITYLPAEAERIAA